MIAILEPLAAPFANLDRAFRARAVRERALLGGMLTAVVFLTVDAALIQPIGRDRSRVESNTTHTKQEIETLRRDIEGLSLSEPSEEERLIAVEREQLTLQLQEIDRKLRAELSDLVPPEAIVSVLEELLDASGGLELVGLHAHTPQAIGGDDESGAETTAALQQTRLYRHGLTLEIEGDFAATLDYLERIERSHWHLLWDRFELRVDAFPTSSVRIDIHTVSESEEWIGV